MNRKLRYCVAVYLLGAVTLGAYLILEAISKGGLERLPHQSAAYVLLLAALYLATSLLWPVLVVLAILQYLGVLPQPITL